MSSVVIADLPDDVIAEEIAKYASSTENTRRVGQFVRLGDLQFEPSDWLIHSYIESDSLWQIVGAPGSYKSFLAIDWCASVASGQDWQGNAVKQGPVLYVVAEGQKGIRRRFRAWELSNGIELKNCPLFVRTFPASLSDPGEIPELEERISEVVDKTEHPALLVFDTLSRNFGPGDENSTSDMTQVVKTLDQFRAKFECSIGIIHHVGHGNGSRGRGSSVLTAAMDAEYLTQRSHSGVVKLECIKSKDSAPPDPLDFKFAEVKLDLDVEDDKDNYSGILERTTLPASNQTKPKGSGKNQQLALDELDRLMEDHRNNLEDAGVNNGEARVSLDDWKTACRDKGLEPKRFSDVKKTLQDNGSIMIEPGNYVSRLL